MNNILEPLILNIEIIDKQHKLIHDTLLKLRSGNITTSQSLSDLLVYITEHFDTEEQLCIKYSFPNTEKMKYLHILMQI